METALEAVIEEVVVVALFIVVINGGDVGCVVVSGGGDGCGVGDHMFFSSSGSSELGCLFS